MEKVKELPKNTIKKYFVEVPVYAFSLRQARFFAFRKLFGKTEKEKAK